MSFGAETPLIQHSALPARSDVHGASTRSRTGYVHTSPNVLQEDRQLTSFLPGTKDLQDNVELSAEARDKLARQNELVDTLEKGRGEIADKANQLVRDQLKQTQYQIAFLRHILKHADSETAKGLRGSVEGLGKELKQLGRHIESPVYTNPSSESSSIQHLSIRETSIEVNSIEISAEFNKIAEFETEKGEKFRIEQSEQIKIQLTQVKVSLSQTDIFSLTPQQTLENIKDSYKALVNSYTKTTGDEDKSLLDFI